MSKDKENSLLRWVSTGLGGLVLFLLGSFNSANNINSKVENKLNEVDKKIEQHEKLEGHPVIIERVDNLEELMLRIESHLEEHRKATEQGGGH